MPDEDATAGVDESEDGSLSLVSSASGIVGVFFDFLDFLAAGILDR